MFLILAALYESWTLPFSVLLSVPVAVVGAFAGLLLRTFDFDVYAQVGIVMLIGLAAKNAILIVEFAKARREDGADLVTAALEGARVRLRPILMTSFAFIFGCLPLWMATGAGAASRRVLGTVVISGMLAATLLAIFLIPMLYVQVERLAALARPAATPRLDARARIRASHDAQPHASARVRRDRRVAALSAGAPSGPTTAARLAPPATIRGAEARPPAPSFGDAAWIDVFQDDELRTLIRDRAGAQRRPPHRGGARAPGAGRARRHPRRRLPDRRRPARRPAAAASPPPTRRTARTAGALGVGAVGGRGRSTSGASTAAPPRRRGRSCWPPNGAGAPWPRASSATSPQAYYGLRALDLQLGIARRTLASRQESLELDPGPRARRRHLARRRPRGRAAGVRRRRRPSPTSSGGSRSRRTCCRS